MFFENKFKLTEANDESLKALTMHIHLDKHLQPNQCKVSTSLNQPNDREQTKNVNDRFMENEQV